MLLCCNKYVATDGGVDGDDEDDDVDDDGDGDGLHKVNRIFFVVVVYLYSLKKIKWNESLQQQQKMG